MSDDKKLNEALDASEKPIPEEVTKGATLKVVDQMHSAKKYLSDKAMKDMARKSTNAFVLNKDSGLSYRTIFFALTVRNESVELAVEKLSKAINELSEDGLIHSTLAPISSLELAKMPMKAQASVVFVYPLVPNDKFEEIKKKYADIAAHESSTGNVLGNLNLDLKDGEFMAEINISPLPIAAMMNIEGKNTEEILQNQIEQFLALLPKGTVVREVNPCAIISIAYPFEVKFYNPLMKDVKSVSTEYVRSRAVVDGQFEQFNLLTAINYFDADQKQLFVEDRK